jgi:hypothetical protein
MSIKHQLYAVCDGETCTLIIDGEPSFSRQSVRQFWAALKKAGWIKDRTEGEYDSHYCPDCAAKLKADKNKG